MPWKDESAQKLLDELLRYHPDAVHCMERVCNEETELADREARRVIGQTVSTNVPELIAELKGLVEQEVSFRARCFSVIGTWHRDCILPSCARSILHLESTEGRNTFMVHFAELIVKLGIDVSGMIQVFVARDADRRAVHLEKWERSNMLMYFAILGNRDLDNEYGGRCTTASEIIDDLRWYMEHHL